MTARDTRKSRLRLWIVLAVLAVLAVFALLYQPRETSVTPTLDSNPNAAAAPSPEQRP